jgi:predicted permease
MNLALNIFQNLIPLYFIIGIAFLISKKFNFTGEKLNSLLIYILIPLVIFSIAVKEDFAINSISLSVIFLITTSTLCFTGYHLGNYFYKDKTKNILAFVASSSNMGYFGFPLILIIYGEAGMAAATILWLTYTIHEKLIGFFIVAKGNYSFKKSIIEILTMPSLYMLSIGLIINHENIELPAQIQTALKLSRDLMIILGMSVVGIGISKIKIKNIDYKFLGIALTSKFILMPTIMFSLLFLEHTHFNLLTDTFRQVALTMSVLPLGVNTVIAATKYKNNPDKTAITVLISTIVALIYIPVFYAIF